MLAQVEPGPSIVVCNTCRLSHDRRDDRFGRRGGSLFAEKLRSVLANHACTGYVTIEEMPCLFSCSSYCSVHIRCQGKIGYVLGRFAPTEENARALLDYVEHYRKSPEGIVPYENWPEGVKNHFIVRTPPENMVWRRDPIP
jgi:predicted metal-binding protein